MRQHIPAQRYESWSTCFPILKPVTSNERNDLGLGAAAFEKRYRTRLFPDPFITVERPKAEVPLSALRVVAPAEGPGHAVAKRLVSEIRKRWGIEVTLLSDDTDNPRELLRSAGPLLLVGSSPQNRVTMEIAKSAQIGPFDAECPGPGGWGITTHAELEAGMAPRYLLAFDEASADAAVEAFLENVPDAASGTPHLRWVHRVSPGPTLKAAAGDFRHWVAEALTGYAARWKGNFPALERWLEAGMPRPYREVVRETFAHDLFGYYWTHGSLVYNAEFLDIGIRSLHYYQWTGDPAALDFFRETMWGLWDYFLGENPQVYISDMDFRLGPLLNDWNWVEHDPRITPEERRSFTLLLLGMTRMVHGYFVENWKDKPRKAFNHMTFKARSLVLASRYFQRWELSDLAEWKADAESVFGAISPDAFKHHEDAGLYEVFVPDHLRTVYEAADRPISPGFQQALAQTIRREWVMTDNFFWPVEYGDSEPLFRRRRPYATAPWLEGATPEQEEIRRVERACAGVFAPDFAKSAYWAFSGLAIEETGKPFPADFLAGWANVPLDPAFASHYGASGPEGQRFDKLAWRSGWEEGSAYLAINGVGKGPGKTGVGHAHHETNSILRMNLGGRIWLTNNGYGKADAALPASILFATRKVGPEDHNLLVVRDAASGEALPPPVNALRVDSGDLPVPYALTEVEGYGGLRWSRWTLVLPEVGFLFVDRARALNEGSLPPLELQWNVLGQRTGDADGSRLEQTGVALEFRHLGSATATWKESGISAWRKGIRSGGYTGTTEMPHQCVLLPARAGENTVWFANGFWLEGSATATWDEAARTLQIETKAPLAAAAIERPWGRMEARDHRLTVVFNP